MNAVGIIAAPRFTRHHPNAAFLNGDRVGQQIGRPTSTVEILSGQLVVCDVGPFPGSNFATYTWRLPA